MRTNGSNSSLRSLFMSTTSRSGAGFQKTVEGAKLKEKFEVKQLMMRTSQSTLFEREISAARLPRSVSPPI